VLVVKKSLIKAKVPKRIGGGTVFFVSPKGEWYLKDAEYREEGGTPDSVGIIRLALAVKLKRAVGEHAIGAQEVQKTEYVFGESLILRIEFCFQITYPWNMQDLTDNEK
uniref:Aminotran_5 domain-containing protein n=1 Tax=Angiostrongylus cantonensis TaxID=6313 RepID=A0A0K0D723_ANGCA